MNTVSQDFSYETAIRNIEDLRRRFPFAEYSVIGRTWCGRGIFSLSLGEGEECVLYAGGLRGQEWLTAPLLFKFFERLCTAYENDYKLSAIKIKNALREKKIVIVPLANPDSLEIAIHGADGAGCYSGLVTRAAQNDFSTWNANARGVDISHNFEHYFPNAPSVTIPSPDFYQGPSPLSEPETRALANLCENHYFKHVIMLSTTGEKLYYNCPPQSTDAAMMARVFKTVCGFGLAKKSEKEKSGGFGEWFCDKYKNPSFEIKAGTGENPIPFDKLNSIYESIEELLVLSAVM